MQVNIPEYYSISQLVGILKEPYPLQSASFFPLGSFWITLICVCIFFLLFKTFHKKGKKVAMKLLVKREFGKINTQISASERYNHNTLQQLSDLIRRVGIVAQSNEGVANLHSKSWINFIIEHDKNHKISLDTAQALANAPYSKDENTTQIDIKEVYKQSYEWAMAQLC